MGTTVNSSALISDVCRICFSQTVFEILKTTPGLSALWAKKRGGWDELGAGWTGCSTGSYHNCLVSFTFSSGLLRSRAVLFDVEHLPSHRESCGWPCWERRWHFCSIELYNGAKKWTPKSSRLVQGTLAHEESPHRWFQKYRLSPGVLVPVTQASLSVYWSHFGFVHWPFSRSQFILWWDVSERSVFFLLCYADSPGVLGYCQSELYLNGKLCHSESFPPEN